MDNAENMVSDNVHQDKEAIASSFGKAADTYDKHAAFQRDVGHRLLKSSQAILPTSAFWTWGVEPDIFSAIARARRKCCLCRSFARNVGQSARAL